ncbi:hypothetical protein K461DRAFT_300604 [Myriangium duriaei CBS 260.36]|uniref:Rhodopsin domain-containing protein n=1 Tax=Myriangium duriaei CBS 260.36 TaxID=1168546 RepID=A0A9P4MJV6_9PEZI|nr:hypothetical protein K461DRAFT_300604 [Myriangium duriaei CBS 260.36]
MALPDASTPLNPYHNNYNSIITCDIISIVLCVSLTGLRLYVRRSIVRKLDWDDLLLVAGVCFFTARCIVDILGFVAFRDQGFANGSDRALLMGSLTIPLHCTNAILIRGAYTFFYLRIIPSTLGFRFQRITILVAYSIFVAALATYGLVGVFKCGSPANLTHVLTAHCLKASTQGVLYNITYAVDICLDWTLFLTGAFVVRRTVHSKRTKMSVIPVLSLGCVASSVAIVIPILNKLRGTAIGGLEDLRVPIVVDILVTCEALLAIVCFCLIALKPLFQEKIAPFLIKASQTTSLTLPTLPTISELPAPIDSPFQASHIQPTSGFGHENTQHSDLKPAMRLDSAIETV